MLQNCEDTALSYKQIGQLTLISLRETELGAEKGVHGCDWRTNFYRLIANCISREHMTCDDFKRHHDIYEMAFAQQIT
jgi:hypothetical protein